MLCTVNSDEGPGALEGVAPTGAGESEGEAVRAGVPDPRGTEAEVGDATATAFALADEGGMEERGTLGAADEADATGREGEGPDPFWEEGEGDFVARFEEEGSGTLLSRSMYRTSARSARLSRRLGVEVDGVDPDRSFDLREDRASPIS